MKATEKKKPVNTVPDGVWEATPSEKPPKQQNSTMSNTTDLQKNGYPTQTEK